MAKSVWIWQDTIGQSQCRGATCGATITWGENAATGKRLCFDGSPVPSKTAYLNDDLDESSPLDGGRLAWQLDLSETHWASCPDAGSFRR